MAHIFPESELRPNEVADPIKLDRALQPLVEKLGGGLNEHDFSATEAGGAKLVPLARVADDAYYAAYQTKAHVSMQVNSGAHAYAKPSAVGPLGRTATLLDTPAWTVLTEDTTGTMMRKSVPTGEDILFVFAQVQIAGWLGTLGTNPSTPSVEAYRVQFALQVDGVVIEDTITGPAHVPDWPSQQTYAGVHAFSAVNDFDYRHKFVQKNGVGLPNHIQPARLTRSFAVVEGSHDIDLVYRRLPRNNYEIDNDGDGSSMAAFNRRLVVVRFHGWAAWAGGGATLAVEAWQDGDLVSSAALVTGRLDKVRVHMNALPEGAARRGAFRNEHLPSLVVWSDCEVLAPAADQAIAATSTYAGYGSTTGWQQIGDGAGTFLRVQTVANLTDNAGVLLVLANVHVARINVTGDSTDRCMGFFCLRYKDATNTWNYLGETEAALTPRNRADPIGAQGVPLAGLSAGQNPCHEDVPLFWAVDTRALLVANPNASSIREIEVVQATWDGTGAALAVNQRTQNGVLTAFLLRGVTLA